jgi:hypothetical protein
MQEPLIGRTKSVPPHCTAVWNTKCTGRMDFPSGDTSSWMQIQVDKSKINEKSSEVRTLSLGIFTAIVNFFENLNMKKLSK